MYKNQLNNLEKEKCKGAAIRCRFQNLVEGEKCTAFFLGLEKQKQNKTIIEELKDNDNNIHRDKIKILGIIKGYYTNLFLKKEGSNKEKTTEILSHLNKKVNTEDKITKEEIPGGDG